MSNMLYKITSVVLTTTMILGLCITSYNTSNATEITEEDVAEITSTESISEDETTEAVLTEEETGETNFQVEATTELTESETDIYEDITQVEEDGLSSEESMAGYIDTGDRVESYSLLDDKNGLLRNADLPASYRSSYLSTVKNQNPYETCWSFSAMGAAETYMLKDGSPEPDYSEYQLAYFFYHHTDDELGNLAGDAVKITNGKNYLTMGGNNYWTMFALSSWIGVGNEGDAPYTSATPASVLSSSLAYQDSLHMTNTRIISIQNKDDVKKAIQEYGGVVSAVYMYNPGTIYFNSVNSALYQNVNTSSNHSIMIVGWDDNYPASNFNSGYQPTGNGAWLVRNSWGTGSVPYFWVSYEDASISKQDAFAYTFEDADKHDYNYQYDGAFSTGIYNIINGSTMANTYQVSGSVQEKLDAVSFALYSGNVDYSIQIYKNSPSDNPLGGEPLLTTPLTGTTTYAGYYTVDLEEDISLQLGEQFTVAVTTSAATGTTTKWFMDSNRTISGINFISSTRDNQSYLISDGYVHDLYEEYKSEGLCPRIKAFTTAVDTGSTIDIGNVSMGKIAEQVYTGSAITPIPSLKYKTMTLKKNRDYSIAYKNNLKIGTATAIITGLGRFSGSRTITFNIVGKKNPITIYNGVDYSAVYDYNYYITKYADLWRTFGTDDVKALAHFVNYGMTEGRQGCENFDVNSYANKYYDLRRVCKNDLKKYYTHYINRGKKEGRIATGVSSIQGGRAVYNGVDYSAVYSVNYYSQKYLNLKKTFKFDDEAYLEYFINYGMKEGQQGIATFNVTSYAYKYYDLRRIYKNNLKNYYLHYVYYGKKEGRIATGTSTMQGGITAYGGVNYSAVFNVGYYANKYADLRKAFGFDDEAYLKHFINYGMKEGRQGSAGFNVANYRNRYSDLRKVFGSDLKRYYLHYINYGFKEGRNGK